jgi:hypothetical protein
MVFFLKSFVLIAIVLCVDTFTPLTVSLQRRHAPRVISLTRVRRTMCDISIITATPNKTHTDLENDVFFRMEEWKSVTSNVIRKNLKDETFFEVDE